MMKSKGLLVLRLAAGIIFVYHGYGKLFGTMGVAGFTGLVAHLGFPIPAFWAWLVALLEFFGGIALILGICTRWFSLLLAIDMLVAFGMVKHFGLPMGDPDLALLGITLALTLMGGGKFSAWPGPMLPMMGGKMENKMEETKKSAA